MTYELTFRVNADRVADVRDLADEFRTAHDRAQRKFPASYPCEVVGHRIAGPLTHERMVAAKHREDLGGRV